ncbi:MAG: DNA-processing protein DprA [Clostridia bacterium]|nr:DNA-processing protein DprA [Clostridia bacterium]
MILRDELVCLWFDYNDYSFSKLERVLLNFNKIDELFDKNLIKSALFDKDLEDIKTKLLKLDEEKFLKQIEDEFYKFGISAVTYVSKDYPEKLKVIDSPPLVLYVKGDKTLLNKKSISIVGTRTPSEYGKIVCEKFTKELSSAGLVTISGLAFGIDTIVAETTLSVGGKTIAVLGGGLDSIYPATNTNLSKRVVENGLLVSEYRIGVKPVSYSFVNRNRIVSALSLGTLIIEAGKKSGTMTTARFAIDQSRELFVVPGNIYSKTSEGTNNLIDEMPDTFTISPDRILSRLKIKKNARAKSSVQVGFEDNSILNLLSNGEKTFDELCDCLNMKPAELATELVKMEVFGLIKVGDDGFYYKK